MKWTKFLKSLSKPVPVIVYKSVAPRKTEHNIDSQGIEMTKLSKIIAIAALPAMGMSMAAPASASADPLLGEIMTVGFNFCPRGWANAEGQLLAINSNQALFSLLGTTYGGDGRTTFALPDLRGRSIVGQGTGAGLSNIRQGQRSGAENVTLTTGTMPAHNHTATVRVSRTDATTRNPINAYFGRAAGNVFEEGSAPTGDSMNAGTIAVANNGGGQAFNIRNPYLGMYNCIATQGVFPSRN